MKKFLLITTFAASLATMPAKAETQDRAYAGLDILFSGVDHSNIAAGDTDSTGVGINLGYKMSSDKFFIAPEVFYDYLDTTTVYRLGAKVNAGYQFAPKFNAFVNVGLANVGYDDSTPAKQSSYSASASKISMLYGVGLSYNITNDWAARASYEWQRFNGRYDVGGTDKFKIGTLRIGAMYFF